MRPVAPATWDQWHSQAGADALEIEVHDDPANAWSDGPQALTCDEFDTTMERIRAISSAISSPRGE